MSEGGPVNSVTSGGSNNNDLSLDELSAFYGVPEDQLTSVGDKMLMILERKVLDFNELKSKNLRLEVTVDEIKTFSSNRQDGLKNEIEKLIKENDSIRAERAQSQEEAARLTRDTQKHQNEMESFKERLSALDEERETLRQSKREVITLVEEKVREVELFRNESHKVLGDNKDLRQQVLDLETTAQNLKSKEIRDRSEIETLTQQLAILQKNNRWLEEEVTSKTEQLLTTRKKNDGELALITSESQTYKRELQLQKARSENLTTKNNELAQSLQEKLIEVKNSSDSLYRSRQEFVYEMSMKQKLIDLLDNQVKCLEGELNASLEKYDLELSAHGKDAENEKLTQELVSLKKDFEKSEQERLKLEALIQELVSGETSEGIDVTKSNDSKNLSPSKNKDSFLRDMSLLKKELIKERHQKERLKRQVESFIVELEYKIPIINSFKERTSMLEKELNDVALLLEHTSNEKEKKEREFEALSKKIKDSESSIRVLMKQRTDLAHQVQFLLMNITVQFDSRGPLNADEVSFIKKIVNNDDPNSGSDSQRVISERLVDFNNIVTLQEKNMELLKTVRNLAEKLESEEKDATKKAQSFEDDTIKEAKEAIVSLQDYNSNLESKIKVLTKECEALKTICSQNGSDQNKSPSINDNQNKKGFSSEEEKLKALEARLTSLTMESSQNYKMLNNEIQELYKSKTQVSIELERERSSKILAEERMNLIQNTLDLARNENQELVKRAQDLQSILGKQDSRTADTVNGLIACNSKLAIMETKITNLEAEKQLLQASDRNSRDNFMKLSEEKNSLRVMVSQLQALQTEREKFLHEIQNTYKQNLNTLEQEKADSRARLDIKMKEAEEMESTKRTQLQWYQDKLDSAIAESQDSKQKLQTKSLLIGDLESEIKKLRKEVGESTARVQSYQTLSSSETGTDLESSLRKELEKAKINLSDSYAETDHYKELLSATEESLSQLTQDYANDKQALQLQIKSLLDEKTRLQDLVNELHERIDKLDESLEKGTKSIEDEKNALEKKVIALETEKQSSQHLKEEYDAQILKLQSDLEQQASYANTAQRKYEEELKKDSSASKTVSELREEIQKTRTEVTKLKASEEKIRQVLEESEKSWLTQKEEYEKQLETSRRHVEDLSIQNSLLYDQTELFSKDKNNGDDVQNAEIKEILTTLRRERDILGTKLTVSQREEQALKRSLITVENELDATKRQLSQFQKEVTTHSDLIEQHEKIMEQLNHLNLLRESNITLRRAAELADKKNGELQDELHQVREKILPLDSELATLRKSVLEKDQQSNLFREEANRWKERSQEILHKQDRIDPDDHKKLVEKVSSLESKLHEVTRENKELDDRFNRLKKQAHEKLNSSKVAQAALSNEINELKETKSNLESKFDLGERKVHELQEKLDTMGNDSEMVNTVKKELADSIQHSKELEQKLQETLQQNEETVKKLTEKIDSLNTELTNLKAMAATTEESSKDISDMRRSLEEEKINFLNQKTEELAKIEEKKNSSRLEGEQAGGHNRDYDELKKEWEREYEKTTLKRIAEAEENLKKRIRLPTEEKIKKVIEKKKAALEDQYKKRLEENNLSLESSDVDKMELKKQLQKDLQEEFDDELRTVKKKAFEEGKQQAVMKSTLLERKISKLEAQLQSKFNSPFKSSSPDASSISQPNLPSKIDEKSITSTKDVSNPATSGERVLKIDHSKPAFPISFPSDNPFTSSPQKNDGTAGPVAFGFRPPLELSDSAKKNTDMKADSSSSENKPPESFSSFTGTGETGASSPEVPSSHTPTFAVPNQASASPHKRSAEDEDGAATSDSKRPKEGKS